MSAFKHSAVRFGTPDTRSPDVGSSIGPISLHNAISDEEGNVRKLYEVPTTLGLFPGRVTYVIEEEGVVRHIFSSQLGVERHVAEAVEALRGYDRIPKRP